MIRSLPPALSAQAIALLAGCLVASAIRADDPPARVFTAGYEDVEVDGENQPIRPKLLIPTAFADDAPRDATTPAPPKAVPAVPTKEQSDKSAAPSKPAASGAPKTVVFNFQNAPWDSVLARFAEMADLSLIMEVRPPGTFSYSDARPHTVAEAMDILNGVLIGKDFLLLRNDPFLSLLPLDKPVPSDLVPRVNPEELSRRGKNEMVSMLLSLKHADPKTLPDELKGVLSKHATIAPVPRLKLLRITDLAGNLKEAVELVQKIDEQSKPAAAAASSPPPPRVEKVLTLKALEAKEAQVLLEAVFARSLTLATGKDRSKLVAVGTQADLDRAEKFLEKVDVPPAENHARTQKAYPLKRARAKTLGESLQAIFPEEKTGARIKGDEQNNAVLVDATPEIHTRVQALVDALDRESPQTDLSERIYKPRHADLEKMLATLQSLYTPPFTRIALDSTGTSIIVRTTADRQVKIAKLVEELDKQPEGGGEWTEAILPIKQANAESLAATLTKLFPTTRTGVTITGDAANSVLIVRAPADLLTRIKTLVEQVDIPAGLGKNVEVIYRPKGAKIAALIKSLSTLYPSSTNVRALPGPDGKSLVLQIPKALEAKVRATLEMIDQESVQAPKVDELYKLKHAQAQALAETLRKLYPAEETAVEISADPTNEVLIISAPAATQKKIKELIERVDVPAESRLEERIYTPSENADGVLTNLRTLYADGKSTFTLGPDGRTIVAVAPASVHKKVEAFLAKLEKAPPNTIEKILRPKHVQAGPLVNTLNNLYSGHRDVRISLDAAGKSAVVVAPPAIQEKIAGLINQLDKEEAGDPAGMRHIYRLEHASAYYVASTLQSLFPASETNGRISYDTNANAVVVVGPDAFQDKIKALITEFDVDPKRNIIEKAYTLAHVPAAQAVTSLQQLVGSAANTTISVAPDGQRIIVLAPLSGQERVERLLKTLDQPPPEGTADHRKLYRLDHGLAYYVANALQTLFPAAETGARITYDSTSNVVIVVAADSLQKKIESMIKDLDVDPKKNLIEKAYTVEHVPAGQVVTALQQMLASQSNTTVTALPGTRRFVIVAPAPVHERAQRLLSEMDKPAGDAATDIRQIYKLAHASAYYVASSLQTLFPQAETGARITYDPTNNVLIVIAPEAIHQKVRSLVQELDVDPKRDVPERTYTVKHLPVPQVVTLLQQALATQSNTTIAASPRKDQIVVVAPVGVQERVARLLATFDQPPAKGSEIERRIYRMKHANSSGVAIALQALYSQSGLPVTVTYEGANNCVIAEAPASLQVKIQQLIDEVDQPGGNRVEKVYRLASARASRLLDSLTTLLASTPGDRVIAGPDDQSLVVSAGPAGQEKVERYLKEFDKPAPEAEVTQKLYRLRHARAASLSQSLRTLLAREPEATVSYDQPNNALVVLARPAIHKRVQQWIDEFDQPGQERAMVEQVYVIKNGSADGVVRALREVYPDPDVAKFSADPRNQTVLARVAADLAPKVAETIKMLDQPKEREDRAVEVIPLLKLEPYAAENAVNALFRNQPSDDRPSIEGIFEPPQLVVRATPSQLKEIRAVLEKMGEDAGGVAATGTSGDGGKTPQRTVRTIRVSRGDPRTIAEAIEKVWPRLRRNPLLLVTNSGRIGDLKPPAAEASDPKSAPVAKEVGKAPKLPGDSKIPVLLTPGVNRLVATSEDADALRLVEELVESLTEMPNFDQGEFTVFYLEHGNAADIAKTIDEAFNGKEPAAGSGNRRGGGARRPDRVRAVADETSNAIIVRASPVDLVNVSRLIESLDDDKASQATAKAPRIIPLKHADADEVMAVLKGIYTDYLAAGSGGPLNLPGFSAKTGTGGKRTSALSVGVDARSNSLVVSAPDLVYRQIQSLVESLDQAALQAGRSYRVLPLKNANPLEVRDAIEILLDRESSGTRKSTSGSGSQGSGSGSSTRRKSTTTPRTRRSRSSTPRSSPSSAVPVPNSRPTAKASEIEEPPRRQTMVTTIGRTETELVVEDRRPRILNPVVQANAEVADDQEPEAVPAVFAQAARNQPPPAAAAARPAEKNAPAEADSPRIGGTSGHVDVRAFPDLGVLLLLGNEADLKLLSEVVAQLEKVAENRALTFQLHPVRFAKAAALAELLNDLYGRLIDARGAATLAQGRAEFIPLARPNALVIAAPKDELAMLVGLADRFDLETPAAGQFKLFRVRHARASELATTIQNFYKGRAQDGELAPEILVEADRRSNTLLIHAGPNDLAELTRLVAQLDVESNSSINEMRVFSLQHTVAAELALTLQEAIQPRGASGTTSDSSTAASGTTTTSRGGPSLELLMPDVATRRSVRSGILENVRITPNRRANTLIVSAPPKTMSLIAALIGQLDVLPKAHAEIKVFTLANSDATTMAQTLRGLFVQLDEQSGRVAVSATPATAGATTLPLIELTFSVDERTNSILVSGTREQLQVVEAIILRLDGSDIEERKTMVYRLKNADAEAVSSALTQLLQRQNELQQLQEGVSLQQQLEREIVVVPERVTNSLLISSTPRFYKRLIELIEKLDELPPQVVIQVLIVQVDLQRSKEVGGEIGLQDSVLFDRSIFPGTGVFTNAGYPFLTPPITNAVLTGSPVGIPGFNFNNAGPLPNAAFVSPSTIGQQGLSNFGVGRTSPNFPGVGGFVFSASSENVNILIRALATCRRLEVLSRPQIMTLDNQQAFIQVGQQVPLVTSSNVFAVGTVSNTVQYRDVGIILEVVPKINPDGSVVMRVDPQISALASPSEVATPLQLSPGVNAAVINITQASTTVSAEDGQTAVIGGLIRKETQKQYRKAPVLGDIPVIQYLFRFDQSQVVKREILIFLTPHVVRNSADSERIKQLEAARVDFCLKDAEKVHGDLGLPTEVKIQMQKNRSECDDCVTIWDQQCQRHKKLKMWKMSHKKGAEVTVEPDHPDEPDSEEKPAAVPEDDDSSGDSPADEPKDPAQPILHEAKGAGKKERR